MATSADISTSLVLTRLALAVAAVVAAAVAAVALVARVQKAVERAVERAVRLPEDLEDLGADLDQDFTVTTDTRNTAVDVEDVEDAADVVGAAVKMETSPVSSLLSMAGASTRTIVNMLTLLRTFRQSRIRHLHLLKGN